MPPLPFSSRPALCALVLALLEGVAPSHAGWAPPTQSSSESDDAGSVTVAPSGSSVSGSTNSTNGGTLTTNAATGATMTSAVNSSYASAGTLTLGGSYSYDGSLTISSSVSALNAGSLYFGGTGTLSTGNFTTGNSVLALSPGTTVTLNGSALTLINGGSYTTGTNALTVNGNTLALNGVIDNLDNGSQLALAEGQTLVFNDGALKFSDGNTVFTLNSLANDTDTTDLSGSLGDLSISPNAATGLLHVKGTVTLHNSSTTALKNVTATVYLSADNLLSADDAKLLTLSLADFVDKGKIGKGKSLSLPLKHKVPSVYAEYLQGKYLIVVLNADNLGSLASTPIVIGPLDVP